MMCQAPGTSVHASSRQHAQILGYLQWINWIGWRLSRQAWSLLFAPKVHFLNTVLSRECPLRPYVRTRPIRFLSAPCTG